MAIHPIDSDHGLSPDDAPKTRHIANKQPLTHSPSPQSSLGDRLHLSIEQEEYEAIKDAIQQVPDIRQEKVANIQKALKSGQYRVSSEDIADRIIQEVVNDRVPKTN